MLALERGSVTSARSSPSSRRQKALTILHGMTELRLPRSPHCHVTPISNRLYRRFSTCSVGTSTRLWRLGAGGIGHCWRGRDFGKILTVGAGYPHNEDHRNDVQRDVNAVGKGVRQC
jgi:hypothetical protein